MTFNKEARARYLTFAMSADSLWSGNFRDLAASVTRMATLSSSGRIDVSSVDAEIARLRRLWFGTQSNALGDLGGLLSSEALAALDWVDHVQLAEVIRVCRTSRTLSDAGRMLYRASRSRRSSTNDADRLRKYLARFGLDWLTVTSKSGSML